MNSLYRFISFPAFVNLVEKQVERYVSPISWEDTYEGYLLRLIEKNDIREVMEELMNTISPNNPEAALGNYLKLWSARWLCYGQCWTTLHESDALWRIYSYDKMTVRIETDEPEINALFSAPELKKTYILEIREVKYDLDEDNGLKSFSEILIQNKSTKLITEPYFHKRKAFEHEREKRVLLLDNAVSQFHTGLPILATLNNYRRQNMETGNRPTPKEGIDILSKLVPKARYPFSKENTSGDIYIEIPDVRSYIKSVMVHPQAEEWIVSLVGTICKRTGLCFKGKSNMYERIS